VYRIEYLQQHTCVEQTICSSMPVSNRTSAAAHVYRIISTAAHAYRTEHLKGHMYVEQNICNSKRSLLVC